MLKTVHGKLSFVLLALLSLVGLLYVALTLYTTRMYIREVNQHLNRALASELAKHLIEKNLLRNDPHVRAPTRAEISQSMVLNPDIEIYILDDKGGILDYSAAPGVVRLKRVSLDPVQRFLAGVGPLPIFGDDPRNPGQQKIFSAQRIPIANSPTAKDRLKGYIYIILGGQKYDAAAGALNRSYIVRWSLALMVGILSFVALTGILLFRFLTRRLTRLMLAMEEFQARHFAEPILAADGAPTIVKIPAAHDEIERLEQVFHQMSERIEAQVKQSHEADVQRREAVSNVSHDLRTPLAALQGYIETLLMKEGSLTADEQRTYLQTAGRHSERLGKLVAELFELAKLDSQEMKLHLEPFSLAELVQDVVQQFHLAAQQQGVQLKADGAPGLPFVRADIGLIERALENLIENALHHTPSGGRVLISLTPAANRMQVQVQDSGEGIAPEDLPRIFERSYRAAKHRSDESSSAGLGLAITRRIVELHGGTITADSVPGAGATFTFSLPLDAA